MVDLSTPRKVMERLFRGEERKIGNDCTDRVFPHFHALFSLNGLNGAKDGGAHLVEITCVSNRECLFRIKLLEDKEIQKVIDKAHFAQFGEEREARRTRILEERAAQKGECDPGEAVDWDVYDSPAKDRRR